MLEFSDDWRRAEGVASEINLSIIKEPLIVNLRPQDTIRHTLVILCKHAPDVLDLLTDFTRTTSSCVY